MLSVLSCNTVCWERFFFTLPFWVTLIGTIYCSVMLWLCATLYHFGILLKDTLPRIETPTLQRMNYSFDFGKRNFNFLTEACLWIWSAQGYSDLFWNHLMCMYFGFLRALTPFFLVASRVPRAHSLLHPPSLCCGRAVEHSVVRLRHTVQISGFDQLERILSAVFNLDGRLRGSKRVWQHWSNRT